MSTQPMEMLAQRFDEMLNKPNLSIVDEIFAPKFIGHFPLVPLLNRSSFKRFMQGFYDAFPDLIMETDSIIMTSDHVVLRLTYYGTHNGDFLGIPASGSQITLPSISILRAENNLIVENWTEIDIIGAVRQISKIPLMYGAHMSLRMYGT